MRALERHQQPIWEFVPFGEGYRDDVRHSYQAWLTTDAAEARVVLHKLLQNGMGESGDLADVHNITAKAVSQICKLALVLYVAANLGALRQPDSEIDVGIWSAPNQIGLWYLDETIRVQRAAAGDPLLEMARRTLAWLRRRAGGTVTTGTLRLCDPRPHPDANIATAVFELLEDLGWLRAETMPGRRKRRYQVHPTAINLRGAR